jgi:hypothetical protein
VAAKAPKKASDGSSKDVLMVYGRSEDGKTYGVLRQRGDELQAGTLRPLDEGKPIQGEVVRLTPRDDSPALFDVEVQFRGTSGGGPAKVASDQYRRGWDTIWSKKRPTSELN